MWSALVWVMGGAMLGASLRYVTGLGMQHLLGPRFPWGTLVVNMVGCFLMGLFFALVQERGVLGDRTKLFLMVGCFGSLTTFSSFALDNLLLMRNEHLLWALGNLVLQNVTGVILVAFGILVGRTW
ncbi:MAG: fluoride efflux transporter CrcB [Myxococcales bacterium]|nr:fluoride efflux transporter CrcB [Myxococcales bacterium]MCB9643005.1 fluoride efflux transporter CrcB [Myxococcales bacterium]